MGSADAGLLFSPLFERKSINLWKSLSLRGSWGILADDELVFFDESLESELSEVHPIKSKLYFRIKQTIPVCHQQESWGSKLVNSL